MYMHSVPVIISLQRLTFHVLWFVYFLYKNDNTRVITHNKQHTITSTT